MAVELAVSDAVADPQPDASADAALVREMILGSPLALEALYDRHATAVFSAAMRVSRDQSVAEDVVQETFLALWNRAESFDPSRGSLPAWLATIARNRTVDHLRAAGRHHRAASFSSLAADPATVDSLVEWLGAAGRLVAAGGAAPDPAEALSRKDARTVLEAALAALGPIERCVVALAYLGGLSQSEIAARLGWPLGTVKTRTRRALRQLRLRLEHPHLTTPAQPASSAASRDDDERPPVPKASSPAATTWMCQ